MAYNPSEHVKKYILEIFQNHHYFNVTPDPKLLEEVDKGRARFPVNNHVVFKWYKPKDISRYLVVKDCFSGALTGSVADIGSREFEKISDVLGVKVTGIDKNNNSLNQFDWDEQKLPFKNQAYDVALCLDTLEHITDIHSAFADLLRIAKNEVIISLPNCWKKKPREMLSGRTIRASYGLPVEKPYDRHRWYMNTEDIEDFLYYNAKKNGFSVVDMVYHIPAHLRRHRLFYFARHFIPDRYFKNFVVNTVFCRMRRD